MFKRYDGRRRYLESERRKFYSRGYRDGYAKAAEKFAPQQMTLPEPVVRSVEEVTQHNDRCLLWASEQARKAMGLA